MAIKYVSQIFGKKINYVKDAKKILPDTDVLILITPWKEYKSIKESEFLKMHNPLVIDTRRILKITNKKIKYIGLGMGD